MLIVGGKEGGDLAGGELALRQAGLCSGAAKILLTGLQACDLVPPGTTSSQASSCRHFTVPHISWS